MEISEYQQLTEDTAVYPKEIGLFYTMLGFIGETGELAEKIKKVIRDDIDWDIHSNLDAQSVTHLIIQEIHNHPDYDIEDELGDIFYYFMRVCEELECDSGAIAERNIEKLHDRMERDVIHGSGDYR